MAHMRSFGWADALWLLLVLAVADRVLMMENAIYSVIAPEACGSIMWRDAGKRALAAAALAAVDQAVVVRAAEGAAVVPAGEAGLAVAVALIAPTQSAAWRVR